MEEIIKEKILDYCPLPITTNKTSTILEQMKKCICKIINRNGRGTGFFCYIPCDNYKIPVLITN